MWTCFYRVALPQLRPALLGGLLLVTLNLLTEFGAFALLRFRTFTTEIYLQYRASFDGASRIVARWRAHPAMLGLPAWRNCGCAAAPAMRASVRARAAPSRPMSWAARAAVVVGFFALVSLATVGVPLGMTLYWLTQPGAASITPAEVSPALLTQATLNSMFYGSAAPRSRPCWRSADRLPGHPLSRGRR